MTRLDPNIPVAATAGPFQARSATLGDAPGIAHLVNLWAERGLTLARSVDEIRSCIHQFVVVDDDDENEGLASCGALVEWPPRMVEIRSVSVADRQQGKGAGRAVVSGLVAKAKVELIDTIVLLTKTPQFFVKQGFVEIEHHELPKDYVEAAIYGCGRSLEGRIAMRMEL